MAQVNAKNGYIALGRQGETYTLETHDVVDSFDASVELDYDNMTELRAMLWDAMRKRGIHSEDALDRAHQIGWEHGAADATDHKDYKLPISESMHDEWDKRYATGYDAGFGKVATSDEPPETPSRPEYIRESRFA